MGTDRKVRLVATESQKYGTRQLRPGNKFSASEPDAEDILALGIGRKEEVLTRPSLKTKVVAPKKRKYVKSGLYKRRDMRAED